MKIVPKDTKPKNYIWKKFTIIDALIFAVILLMIAIIISTGGAGKAKFIVAGIILLISICLFFPANNRLMYQEIYQMIKYTFYKKRYKGKEIDMLLPFTDIDEEGFIVYPGYYGKVIEIGSKDFALLDDILQDMDIEAFTKSINVFDKNDVIDLVKIDKALILDSFLDDLQDKIDIENNNLKKAILYSKLSDLEILNNPEAPLYKPSYYLVVYGSHKEDINILLDSFMANFSKTKLETKFLDRIETAIFLKYNFTRNFNEREAYEIDKDKLIEWIKPKDIEFHLNHYLIDGIYAQTSVIEDYPLEVGSAWASNIFNIPATRAVMHIVGVDQDKGIKRVDRAINEVISRREQLSKASEELNNEVHIDSMKELLVSLQTENERFYDVSFTISSFNYDKNDIKAFRKKAFTQIKNDGFKVNNLWSRQIEGVINSNISKRTALKIYERGINSSTIASSFPFVFSNVADNEGHYLGINAVGYPVLLDIWKRNHEYKNSNGIVIGTSGSGKSYFLKVLLNHLYSTNTKIYILDPENEYRFLCNNLRGKMIDIGRGDKGRINPFHIYPSISDSDDEEDTLMSTKATFNAHLRTLESFFKVILPNISDEALETLNNAIIEVYSIKGIGESTDVTILKPSDFPTFDDLYRYLENGLEINKENIYKRNLLSSALTYISKFASGGRYSDLWNGESTLKADNDFTVINFQSLFSAKNDIVANAQMLLVFRFLEQQLINQKNTNDKTGTIAHTLIVVDEAHLFIDKKYPIALDFFYQMTKRIRKYGGSFIPATQSISDWNANEELRSKTSAILKNSQYSFVFNLKGQDIEDLCDLYKSTAPINMMEQKEIATAETGQCFFIGSESLRTTFLVDSNDTVKDIFSRKFEEEELEILENLDNESEEKYEEKEEISDLENNEEI